MNIKHTLLSLALCLPFLATAQCSDPITLNSVLVSNTQCGSATGTIIVTPAGGIGAYVFEWAPSVSNSNVATNLGAGIYTVHITRANEPSCTLDTAVLVNNSNGPQVQATISPAQCFASNGSISLTPTDFTFNWSNGASSSEVTGLASKNYFVTVTNPGTGCFSIFKYFVPKDFNSLTVNNLVQEDAKCGMSLGRAKVIVVGGSGQYAYNPGPGPQYNNLAAGDYAVQVVDNATGCMGETGFTIEDLQVNGAVSVTPHNVRCAGQATGFVEFGVSAGQNFEIPYVYFLRDENGDIYTPGPGTLVAGNYTLQIADADGCTLPPVGFSISESPAFNAQAQATPETCAVGGQINLSISGGNGGPYIVNWADLPGEDNPKDRTNLRAGRYSAVVFDSLFCTYTVDTVLVAPNCNNLTMAHMVLKANVTDFFCVAHPPGLAVGATTFSLVGGGVSGNSAYGAWSLNSDGCLAYLAGSTTGYALDTICIVSTAAQIGLQDTICVIVSITQDAPTKTSVYFTVQVQNPSTACGTIPPGFSNPLILQLGRPGLNGTSDVFGTYSIDNATACATFFAANTPGYNVDEIRVAVFDTAAGKSHIFSYFPTVLPKIDCAAALNLADTLHFITTDCDGLAFGCVPIPYDDIVNYTIIDNNTLYNQGYLGCATDTTISYNVAVLPPGGGPYQLTEWKINGQTFTGNFVNFNGLVDLMNLLDAPPFGWTAQGVGFIRGGKIASTYGPLRIKSAGGNTAVYNPSSLLVPLGTEMRFVPGFHEVIFRNVLTACSDTATINAICYDCAPIHSHPLDAFGNVKWDAATCASDTVFCTNIPNIELGQYIITDNGQPFLNYTLCGSFVGMTLDTGYHQLHFQNTTTTCAWSVRFYLDCKNVLDEVTIPVSIPVGSTVNVCLDTSELPAPIISIANICEHEGSEIIGYALNDQSWCVQISGLNPGADTLCIQLCNGNGECANYILLVSVTGTPTDSLLAVPDAVFTIKNGAVDFSILANDIVDGIVGNLGGLSNVEFLTNPALGTFSFNSSDGTVSYTPEPGECGVDSFSYRITDGEGKQSTATIKVTISCDKILIFKGISPNGDGLNDAWHILGIEQFPDNAVQVFNRWGNLVFEQKGYTNSAAWAGQWNGKELPDGTYFYLIELGGNGGKMNGWLEILR
ncbi:MAG: gliding motility-associated C-terminal domain-containing protein [Saprospiraceae bacterium]